MDVSTEYRPGSRGRTHEEMTLVFVNTWSINFFKQNIWPYHHEVHFGALNRQPVSEDLSPHPLKTSRLTHQYKLCRHHFVHMNITKKKRYGVDFNAHREHAVAFQGLFLV